MIYDCFTFFNELDLLKIRLKQYYNLVDKFVIVECAFTQKGEKKEFNFEKNKTLFSEFIDKIIYIKVESVPAYKKTKDDVDWSIENFQRNAILRGLADCTDDDIIIISDLDEFIKPSILKNLTEQSVIPCNNSCGNAKSHIKQFAELLLHSKKLLYKKNAGTYLDYMPIALEQEPHPFFMNAKENFKWYGTVITKYKNLCLPQNLRDRRNCLPYIQNAGYHFSYMGGAGNIVKKLRAITEGGKLKLPDSETVEEYVENCLKNGIDIWNPQNRFYKVSIDEMELSDMENIRNGYPKFFME